MRVAYIRHAYHVKTGSNQFLVELLERYATVEKWDGEPGNSSSWEWAAEFDENRYDVIVIFQLHEAFDLLSGRHPNVIFIPMYDAMFWNGAFYWKPSFQTAKIACFSWALRQEVARQGAVNATFQYYPDPAPYPVIEDFDTLRGLLWYRRREIPPALAFGLCGHTEFDRFIVHDAPDPGHETTDGFIMWPHIRRIDRTQWSTDGRPYKDALRDSNVFFAPRPSEGIGMSFLGAMASGHCVVAPNAPTMNEYISHGASGLLYDPRRRVPLDFSDARAIGARARESIERGHQRWLTSIPALLDFVATPTAALREGARSLIPVCNRYSPDLEPRPPGRPLISVVTVCRNAAAVLEATLDSVTGQTGCDFEYVVLDGMSSDDSVEIIKRHADRIDRWRSEPDDGPYHAMNAALELARGEWVLFMNAGDTFASSDALRRMFAHAPADADVVYGHHLYRLEDGTDELRHAAEFETTWSRLRRGDLWFDWLSGIPGHQATAVRRELLSQLRFDKRYQIAADHDLLFRARANGARFFNCDEVVAIYAAGGISAQRYDLCQSEWLEIARSYGDPIAAARFYAWLANPSAGPNHSFGPVRFPMRIIRFIHGYSPTLARMAERVMRNRIVRGVGRRILRRRLTPPAVTLNATGPEVGTDVIRPSAGPPPMPERVEDEVLPFPSREFTRTRQVAP